MKLSVSAWSVQRCLFTGELTLEQFIDFCREQEAEAVELLDCFWKDEGHPERIRSYLQHAGLPVSCYSIGNDLVQDEAGRRKEIEKIKEGIDMAVYLGAGILRVFSGEAKESIPFETAREGIIEAFRECAAYAQTRGVVMALENHGLFAGSSSQVKGILEAVGSGYLGANTDTGNFLLVGENPLEAVRNLSGSIAFVHFKDFVKVQGEGHYTALDGSLYNGTILGDGDVPMQEITQWLASSGYRGYLSIEYEGEGEPLEETRQSITYTKQRIKQAIGCEKR
jgi:sugar phosphate isomerase/epimerase